jgi:hypothetical protein
MTVDSWPVIAWPFALLLLIFAVRVFNGLITTPGSYSGLLEVIFTFAATVFVRHARSCRND